MTNPSLQPIVVPPLVSGPFECFGDGLLYRGIKCEHPKMLKTLLIPVKGSRITGIRDKDRSRMWWRAQCLHYGLPSPLYSTISVYRACLERALRQSGGLRRPQQLIDLEMEQNAAFIRLNSSRSAVNLQQQLEAARMEKSPRGHVRTRSNLVPQVTTSRKRKSDAATHSCHPNVSQLSNGEFIVPVSMKKARVNAPVPSAAKPCSRPWVVSKSTKGDQSVRKGTPGGPSGSYELDHSFGPSSRSDEKSKLYVTMLESGWFQAALLLPGFFECLIRPRTNVNIAINGYLRFEWCGWNEQTGEVVPPSPGNVGWLKIYNAEGRVKGAIQTPLGPYLIQGRRVKSGSHIIQEKWEDYSGSTYSHIGG